MGIGNCIQCGAELVRKGKTGPPPKYCSATCRAVACSARAKATGKLDEWERNGRALRAARRPDKACRICGENIAKGSGNKTLCGSDACRLANNARRVAPHVQRRRARMAGADAETFFPVEVYERDGWLCGICAAPVDPSLVWPDQSSPSLDHIRPLSRGGDHTRANTRLSHLRCNVARGNRIERDTA